MCLATPDSRWSKVHAPHEISPTHRGLACQFLLPWDLGGAPDRTILKAFEMPCPLSAPLHPHPAFATDRAGEAGAVFRQGAVLLCHWVVFSGAPGASGSSQPGAAPREAGCCQLAAVSSGPCMPTLPRPQGFRHTGYWPLSLRASRPLSPLSWAPIRPRLKETGCDHRVQGGETTSLRFE